MKTGIALGSNLGDRLANLREARRRLLDLSEAKDPALCSRIYETEPIGTAPGAAAFLNAVAEIHFAGDPRELLQALQSIEQSMGRPSRRPRNASRTIDLDVLYAGDLVIETEEIVIPHPRLTERRFVLQPLCDIHPELVLPLQTLSVAQLLARLEDPARVELFAEEWIA
jgi:2-amino-4-hydroxy-6-hydroxymethyldihydropteridine diphosphokinase